MEFTNVIPPLVAIFSKPKEGGDNTILRVGDFFSKIKKRGGDSVKGGDNYSEFH